MAVRIHTNVISLGLLGPPAEQLAAALHGASLSFFSRLFGAGHDPVSLGAPDEDSCGAIIEYRSNRKQFSHTYFHRGKSSFAELWRDLSMADCAILLLESPDKLAEADKGQVALAAASGVERVAVRCISDQPPTEKPWEDVFFLLSDHGYPREKVSVVTGPLKDKAAAAELLKHMDMHFRPRIHPEANPEEFRMPIDDVFSIKGRGVVVTGHVERGSLKPSDKLAVVGDRAVLETQCGGIETFNQELDMAKAGDNIGVLLAGVSKNDLRAGAVLTRPGVRRCDEFTAELYVLRSTEGGTGEEISGPTDADIWLGPAPLAGTLAPAGTSSACPGERAEIAVTLARPTALAVGVSLAARQGERTIAAGKVLGLPAEPS
jgi:elongation factor Tu